MLIGQDKNDNEAYDQTIIMVNFQAKHSSAQAKYVHCQTNEA